MTSVPNMGIHGTQYMIQPQPRNVCCSHRASTFIQISHRPVISELRPSKAVSCECHPIATATNPTPRVEATTMTVVRKAMGTWRSSHRNNMTTRLTTAATMTVAEPVRKRVRTDSADHTMKFGNLSRLSLQRTATQIKVSRAMNASGFRLPTMPWMGPPRKMLPSTQI